MTLSVVAQGTVLVARDNRRLTALDRRASAKRSIIREFSRASRRRMIELMARLNPHGRRTTFLTLTFSGTPSALEATRAFKAFTMRLRRRSPHCSAIWRKERQKRGSFHYHLIIFGLPYWSQKQIQYAWECCTGEDMSRVHVKLLRGGKKQATYYIAKYCAKVSPRSASLDNAAYSHVEADDSTSSSEESEGRLWGYINRAELPFAPARFVLIDDDAMIVKLWKAMFDLSGGRAASQPRNARFYGTCCYALLSSVVSEAQSLIYDISHETGEKLRWYEYDHTFALA